MLTSGEPLVIPDVATHPLLEIVRHEGHKSAFSSLAILPILYEGRPMGVLFLRARHAFAFGDRELALCRTVSNAMAIALRNARVMQSLRDQTQQVTVARFEAERRLRTLQRYADFFESAADGIVVIDAEGHLLFSNPRARAITGYTEADLRGRRVGDLFASEDATLAHELRVGFTRGPLPAERRRPHQAQERRASPSSASTSTPSCARRASSSAPSATSPPSAPSSTSCIKTKDFLQRIIDSSVDAIVSADIEGRASSSPTRAAERIYGIPVAELLGRDVRTLYPEGVAHDVMRLIRAGGGRVEGLRTEILDANGERVPVLALGRAPLRGGHARRHRRHLHRSAREDADGAAARAGAGADPRAGAAGHRRRARRGRGARAQPAADERDGLRRAPQAPARARAPPRTRAAEIIFNEAERMAEIVRKIGKITKYETKSYVGPRAHPRPRSLGAVVRSTPPSRSRPPKAAKSERPARRPIVDERARASRRCARVRCAAGREREARRSPSAPRARSPDRATARSPRRGARLLDVVPVAWLDQLLVAALELPAGERASAAVVEALRRRARGDPARRTPSARASSPEPATRPRASPRRRSSGCPRA